MPRSKDIPLPIPYQSTLERFPEHVKAIGMISIEMANLEIMLAEVLAAALNLPSEVAQAMYFAPQAAMARLSILEAVAEVAIPPAPRKDVNKFLGTARELIGTRNKHIHNAWAIHKETGKVQSSSLPIRKGTEKPIPISDLKHLVTRLRKLITASTRLRPAFTTIFGAQH